MVTMASFYTFAFDGLDKTIKLFSLFVACVPFSKEEEEDDDEEEDGGGGADDADE